jgi:hypothetical protein
MQNFPFLVSKRARRQTQSFLFPLSNWTIRRTLRPDSPSSR